MVNSIFGDMLFRPDPRHIMTAFPSPETLKQKILISTKPPENPEEVQEEGEQWPEETDERYGVNYMVEIISFH